MRPTAEGRRKNWNAKICFACGLAVGHSRASSVARLYKQSLPKHFATAADRFRGLSVAESVDFAVDVAALQADVAKLNGKFWRQSVNHDDGTEGGQDRWKFLMLRAVDGDFRNQYMTWAGEYEWTAIASHSSYIRNLLAPIEKNLARVRISNLYARERSGWHLDWEVPFSPGERWSMHTEWPEKENPQGLQRPLRDLPICRVHFVVNGSQHSYLQMVDKMLNWDDGDVFCADFSLPHYVVNFGQHTRVHLIMDIMMNATELESSALGRAIQATHASMVAEQNGFGKRTNAWQMFVDDVRRAEMREKIDKGYDEEDEKEDSEDEDDNLDAEDDEDEEEKAQCSPHKKQQEHRSHVIHQRPGPTSTKQRLLERVQMISQRVQALVR